MNKELIEKIITYNYNEYGAEFGDALVDLKHENEWLHHIIKEVREDIKDTIERYKYYGTNDLDLSILSFWVEKLEILDKGGK